MKFAKLFLMLTLILAACTPIQPQGTQPGGTVPEGPATPPSAEEAPPSADDSAQMPPLAGSLMGTQWNLESFGPPGEETAVVGETPLTLEFSHEGQVSGNAGCNSFSGTYLVQDDTLVLGELISTLMACVDDAVMEQELQYLDALQTVSTFELGHDQLTIHYEQGVLNFSLIAIGTVMATPTPAPETNNLMPGL